MSQSSTAQNAKGKATLYRVMRARKPSHIRAAKRIDRECFRRDVESAKWARSVTWIVVHIPTGHIVGYACLRLVENESLVYLSRAGVTHKHRGNGLQRRLIRVRVAYGRRLGRGAITYTVHANPKSVNNLIACGFRYYEPQNAWAGRDMLYWYNGKGKLT